ncbi:IS110 family transposase [Patescibacteria group bacterium]|nr:IS110 family transposase [Patescibacteria group bacterium]
MLTTKTVVVGVDVHKYSHTAIALDCWGQEKSIYEFSNDTLDKYVNWLDSLGKRENVMVALEDVSGYGTHIVKCLVDTKFMLRYVPAILTERGRKRSIHREKSDKIDAGRVAKVILTKYEETLPAKESIANKEERGASANLDFLITERRGLVKEKTVLKNQLHALLHQYAGDHYADGFPKAFTKKAILGYQKQLKNIKQGEAERLALANSIFRRLSRLNLIQSQIEEIDKSLRKVTKQISSTQALANNIHGCGMITAATLMAEVTTIARFKTKSQFARYSGVAPVAKSSGRHNRLYTSPYGNRKVNRALHTIALSQIACRGDDRGKCYYQKKITEGKTKLWALRCLKRQLSNRVFKVLKDEKRNRQQNI